MSFTLRNLVVILPIVVCAAHKIIVAIKPGALPQANKYIAPTGLNAFILLLMTKILIFIDWFVPGYKAGGPISSNANLVDHLGNSFEFYVLTRDTDYCETTPYPTVQSDAWNKLPNGANVYYISTHKLGFRNLIKVCQSVEFDCVYINGIYSLYFSLFPLLYFKYFTRKKVIVSSRGMLSDHTFSSKKGKKKLFYALARFTGLYKGITFHATNENEADQIRKNVGFKGIIKVAPNLPPKGHVVSDRNISKHPGVLRLISIARVSPEKNTLYALEVIEKWSTVHSPQSTKKTEDRGQRTEEAQSGADNLRLETLNLELTTSYKLPATSYKQRATHLTFDLYGTIYSQDYWNQCEQVIRRLPANITVNFCGPLEKEKIPATLQQYHFLFMPSQGENYGHAIVESFLAGCPVIISDRTPWRGLREVQSLKFKVQSLDNETEICCPPSETHNLKPETLNLKPTGIGWDLPLEEPEQFVKVMDYCAWMGQETYETMRTRTALYGKEISNNASVLLANRQLFE